MQQVFAEQPLAHALLEILMRRGDDAYVRFQRRVAADAVILAVGQHPQQANLQVRRHVADLVQKQRAALGLLESPATRVLRAGERTALVPEQFGFEQVLGDSRGIDGHERAARPRAVPVQMRVRRAPCRCPTRR